METALKLFKAVKTYRMGTTEVHALRGVDLEVKKGEMIAIMGPSGSGKSTLLNLIGALDKPTSGSVIIDGIDLSGASEDELTKIRRDKVGFIFQFYNLIPVLTAYENVELPMLIKGVANHERRSRSHQMLEKVGILGREKHSPDELSGGEQQRVAIARVLAKRPSVILADEPTGDLDSTTGKQVITILRELSKTEDVTVILVTHDLQMAQLADRILEIKDGQIVKEIQPF